MRPSKRSSQPTPQRDHEPARAGRVAILGRPNVGKSTLLNALLGERIAIVSHHPQTTRDAILGVLTKGGAQYVFVDTPGLHRPRTKLGGRMNAAARDAAREADVVLFVTDVGPAPRASLRDDDLELLRALPKEIPVILVLNKIDRVKPKSLLLPLLEAIAKEHDFKGVVPVSAARADNLEGILAEVRPHLPEQPKLFEEDALSDKPLRFFVGEFVREQILRKTRQEVPHGVAVVVERFDESDGPRRGPHKGDVTRIELAIHVDRESHKKILIGARGAMLKAIGTEARARVEELLGKHVHLQLWVRVTPGWYEDESKLADLGYGGGS